MLRELNSSSMRMLWACMLLVSAFCGCIKVKPATPPQNTNTNAAGTSSETGNKSEEVTSATAELSGQISVEGSSTVFPITQAVSREFEAKHPGVQVPVAGNGTTAGFKKFVNREVEICDASRPIKESEITLCQEKGIEYLELQVAIDGLTVVVNNDNDWVDAITVADLKRIWDEGSSVKKWNEINPAWPDQAIELFGAGPDSGTFDYFTEVINGKSGRTRGDYSPSENDNILVSGVSGNRYALGYFGFAYYVSNQDKLKALKIAHEEGAEAVAPTSQTVENGTYTPLSRPLFIYIDKAALKRPEVAAFAQYYLSDEGQDLVEKRKYVRMNSKTLEEMRGRLVDALAAK